MAKARYRVGQVIKMVLAGLVGIRKSADSHAVQHVSPKAIVITALGCGLCLILLLLLLVKVIIHYTQ